MKELEQRITENGIDYILIGDYYYPDLELPKDEEPHYSKYGSMRLDYIKEHKKGLYSSLRMEGRLMIQCQGITEDMKSENWLGWLGAVNNIHSAAEEIICNELIYQ